MTPGNNSVPNGAGQVRLQVGHTASGEPRMTRSRANLVSSESLGARCRSGAEVEVGLGRGAGLRDRERIFAVAVRVEERAQPLTLGHDLDDPIHLLHEHASTSTPMRCLLSSAQRQACTRAVWSVGTMRDRSVACAASTPE